MLVEQLKFHQPFRDYLGEELWRDVLHFEDSRLFEHLVKLIDSLLLDREESEAIEALLKLLERIVDES